MRSEDARIGHMYCTNEKAVAPLSCPDSATLVVCTFNLLDMTNGEGQRPGNCHGVNHAEWRRRMSKVVCLVYLLCRRCFKRMRLPAELPCCHSADTSTFCGFCSEGRRDAQRKVGR